MKRDKDIIRRCKKLAKAECASWKEGMCLPDDRPCYVINPAYPTIHDGSIDCDWFLLAVLPIDHDLNTAVWHEIFREEGQPYEVMKECARCHKPFVPASNRQRYCHDCGAAADRAGNRDRQRRFRQRHNG